MKEIIVSAQDRKGLLADITEVLAKAFVDIKYISAHTIAGKTAVHLVTDNYQRSKRVLAKAGYHLLKSDILVIKLIDKVGELAKVSRKLANNDIGIRHIQFLAKKGNKALLSLKVDMPSKAARLLKSYL